MVLVVPLSTRQAQALQTHSRLRLYTTNQPAKLQDSTPKPESPSNRHGRLLIEIVDYNSPTSQASP